MVRGIDATLFVFAPEDIGAQTEVEDWMLEKARSFGGDRSAAGRYAAEQRWKGHVKAGAKDKDKPDPSDEVQKIKTRLKALNSVLQRFGVELEIREKLGDSTSPFMRGESATGLYDPVDIPDEVKKAAEEIQRLGTRLLELADQKLVADGVLSQREVDAANAEGKAQETAMKINRGALHAILGGEETTFTIEVNGVSKVFQVPARMEALASDYREARKVLETLISMSQDPDRDFVPDREIREAQASVRDAAYHFGQEFNDWYFRQTVGQPTMYQNATTESARLVQQARFKALQELLGAEQFTMSKNEAEADGHLTLKYLPREAAGPMPTQVTMHRFVDSTLSLLPKEAIKTLKDTKVVVQDDKDGFYYYSSKQNMVAVGQEILSDKAVKKLGPDTRGALGHEIVHAISYADVATRALEQGALANLRGLRKTDGFYGVMPVGTSLVSGGAAFVVDDLMDAYSGRVYQFKEYMTRGIPTSIPMSQYEATEMLSTGFEYLVGAGRIRQGYDPYVAGLTAGWMAMMTARGEGAA